MALGHEPDQPADAPFNMAVMGLRLASRSNGVSKLHGRVSRQMFAALWQGVPVEEVPIGSVTNGVHARTWVSQEMSDLLDRYVLPEWHEAGPDRWSRIDDVREEELWRVREQGRHGLVGFVRRRLREAAVAQGLSESDAAWADDVLDGRVLTIGFARRFARLQAGDPAALAARAPQAHAARSATTDPGGVRRARRTRPTTSARR